MSDTPKFTVVDRRRFRADEEDASAPAESSPADSETKSSPVQTGASAPGPRLVEQQRPANPTEAVPEPVHVASPAAVADMPPDVDLGGELGEGLLDPELPPAPTAEESSFQKAAYGLAAERLDDLIRAQNPGVPMPEKVGFDHLVQQLYLSAMMQMGAGTPEGQRPRIDILGARQTIDLLSVVMEKTAGNLNAEEERTLLTVLYELHMTFLELTRMISAQAQAPLPPPPGGAKR